MAKQSLKYLLSLPPLIGLGVNVLIEGAASQSWWSELPWFTINYTTVLLMVSFLLQDALAPQSWLRRWWFNARSPFLLEDVILNDEYDPARILIRASVRFRKIPTNGRARFSITPTRGTSAGVVTHAFSVNLGDPHLGVSTKLDVGVLMIPYPHWTPSRSVWGASLGPKSLQESLPDIIIGQPVCVSMEIDGFSRSFILMPSGKSAHKNPPNLSVLTENDAEYIVGMK